jgi:nucleoside-diphosphate-sugar epimerase
VSSRQPANPRARPARGTGDLLVTGGTGLLGRQVCGLLGQGEERFRALIRPTSARSALADTGAWLTEGDLTHPASLVAPLEGVRRVVHLAGVVRSRQEALERAVHVHGTANLLAAARGAGVRRIVAVSSDTVLRARRSSYAQSKADAEELLLAWATEPGHELVILRPPMLLGVGSPHLKSLRRLARLPLLPVPSGAALRSPVAVHDVAAAVVEALRLPASRLPDRPLDLAGAEQLPIGQLVQAVARATDARAPILLPLPVALAARAARLLGPTFAARVRGLREGVVVDDRLARDLIGWSPRTIEEALAGR